MYQIYLDMHFKTRKTKTIGARRNAEKERRWGARSTSGAKFGEQGLGFHVR